ncbi:hypothetical protein M378DRAFT_177366 [Amanita muscaria Koide BX008]|uniref:Small RNA 2'-O-methyltransferase n=1 Tax=Amanita muscaria (strain Koide BX008) TaxID=946122 RepID=A0A0C2SW63_AMAMK|nr:hypothetical protein M378DRAFT_177366 [Amanita muscaria Koide BX008]
MSRRDTEDTLINESIHVDDLDPEQELKVTFYPPLYVQRRLWVLNFLRTGSIAQASRRIPRDQKVLDVGCGEGQLLSVLCQPAPWLRPPPPEILPLSPIDSIDSPALGDEVIWLHPTVVHGLDVSSEDLAFALREIAPIATEEPTCNSVFRSSYSTHTVRWDDLQVKVWKGGLQTINEEFVDIECIVSTEVIEHLPPDILPAFAPILLGVYHPHLLLITTPSYTFNARFLAPDAPKSSRQGFPDPTGRTDRIYRHDDHKFEWTVEEFETWCHAAAAEWGYEVTTSAVGKAMEKDPWGRDDHLGGASQAAAFRRLESTSNLERERKGREIASRLGFINDRHELLASYQHAAHPSSMKPKPLSVIGDAIKSRMEQFKVAFIRLEEIWFEHDIAIMCGGWIECLAEAADRSDHLRLNRSDGMRKERSTWTIELIGATQTPTVLWPTEEGMSEDVMAPDDWLPEEETSAEDSDWEEPTGHEGDVSWNEGKEDEGTEGQTSYGDWGFKPSLSPVHWSGAQEAWGSDTKASPEGTDSPTDGWEGDHSEDTS